MAINKFIESVKIVDINYINRIYEKNYTDRKFDETPVAFAILFKEVPPEDSMSPESFEYLQKMCQCLVPFARLTKIDTQPVLTDVPADNNNPVVAVDLNAGAIEALVAHHYIDEKSAVSLRAAYMTTRTIDGPGKSI